MPHPEPFTDVELAYMRANPGTMPVDTRRVVATVDRVHRLLLLAYDSGHRKGWEEGPSVEETMDELHAYLCNMGLDPAKVKTPRPTDRYRAGLLRAASLATAILVNEASVQRRDALSELADALEAEAKRAGGE